MKYMTIADFENSEISESVDGEHISYGYGATEVLEFIKNNRETLANSSNGEKTDAFRLLKAIFPELRMNREILSELGTIGNKKIFEELINSNDLFLDETAKVQLYQKEIQNVTRRIEELEEEIDNKKILGESIEVIEKLEAELEQEESRKSQLKLGKQEKVEIAVKQREEKEKNHILSAETSRDQAKIYDDRGFDQYHIHKDTLTKYDSEGYDWEGYNGFGCNKNGRDREGRYYEALDIITRKKKEEILNSLVKGNIALDDEIAGLLEEIEARRGMDDQIK